MSQQFAPMPDYGGSMPTPPLQTPPKKKRTGLIIGLIAGGVFVLLAVLVVIALVIFLAVRNGGSVAGPSPEEKMTAVVTDYMDALAAGDGAGALEIEQPELESASAQLPDDAYAAALEAAPVVVTAIAEPVYDSADESEGAVSVDYTVGGEPMQHEFTLFNYSDDDTWSLIGLGATANVPESLSGLGVTINGAAVEDEQQVYLLPGAYTVATELENFALSSEEPLLVANGEESLSFPDPVLSEDGQNTFRGAVQEAVDDCIAQTTLEAGCGMQSVPAESSDGWTVTEDTVKRTMSEDTQRTIDTMEGTPSYDEPTYVEGDSIGSLDTTMECTKNGQNGICEIWLGGGMSIPNVDMADPELPVTWS
ncbi:hypothetical protein [Brachybacterium sp. FME24]|uniref:hypothetical protein n=1 Tax=Brachybacterium sp. FME24 TaxID=2742605 RepID=UPI0018662B41|nr:hypothetical protein [Brachybacterium sp. FME24]